jgi:hypothetical protein
MSRRSLVVALSLVLALAIVAPTLAQDQSAGLLSKGQFAKKTARQAKAIAKDARSLAKRADRRARSAKGKALKARSAATAAGEQAAGAAQQATSASQQAAAVEQQLNDQRAVTATHAGTVTTSNDAEYVDLGGPEVTVRVPESGLIEVYAQAAIADGAISLYEDGQQVPDQDPNDACDGPQGVLINFVTTPAFVVSTPGIFSFTGGCGSNTAPGPVLFETTPGEHTYELRYADCGCEPDPAEFSDRMLAVVPRP